MLHSFCGIDECEKAVVDEVVVNKDGEEDTPMVVAVNPAL